jgi:predicted CXXCH cytochrome family protein
MLDEVKDEVVHQPFKIGECLTCHNAHAGNNQFHLINTGGENCYKCHTSISFAEKEIAYQHMPFKEEDCTACHNPHGSKIKGQLNRPLGNLCLSCHDNISVKLKKEEFKHAPVQDKKCLECHTPHFSKIEYLLGANSNTLCSKCHVTTSPSIIQTHNGISIKHSNCIGCHESHSSINKGLLRPIMHTPFADKDCKHCHE